MNPAYTLPPYYNAAFQSMPTSDTHVCQQAFRSRIILSFQACYMYCQSPPPEISNILRNSSYKTFSTPSPQLRCPQTPPVCICPFTVQDTVPHPHKTKSTMSCNISIQRILPLDLSYVKQSQSLPKPSSATAAPFVPLVPPLLQFQNPNPQETAQLK